MIRTECSGVFENGSLFPLPAENTRGFFSDNQCENLVELLEAKLTEGWGPFYDWVPLEVSLSDLSTMSLHQVINHRSGFPTLVLVPMEVSALGFLLQNVVILCSPLFVSPIWGTGKH